MNQHPKPAFKVVVSLFIVFHLFSIFVLPNPDGILYRTTHSIVGEYGNLFGFNTTWRFFSPTPAIRLLEYEVFSKSPDGELKGEVFRFPRGREFENSRENFNRKVNHSMYMMLKPDLLEKIMGPRLCRLHPEAESIALTMKGLVFPSIEKSKFQGRERETIGEIQTQYLADIDCRVEESP